MGSSSAPLGGTLHAMTCALLLAALTVPALAQEEGETEAVGELEIQTPLPTAPWSRSATFRVTAYCLDGRTASGAWTGPGVVAVDRAVIPLGSTLAIEGLGDGFRALDTGGGVHGNHIDRWMASCAAAREWGVQYRTVSWSPP